MTLEVHAPGKVMLVGEYVALRGAPVLAMAVGPGLVVELIENTSDTWIVHSELWETARSVSIREACPDHQKEPLLACVWDSATRTHKSGGVLHVRSQIRVEDGLGSSSALRLAVATAFSHLDGGSLDPLRLAWDWQKISQKHASGYDVVTQHYGGCVKMERLHCAESWPGDVQKLELHHFREELELWCGGGGAPTGPVMKDTMRWLDEESYRWAALEKASQNLVDAFQAIAQGGDSTQCYKACGEQRRCFEGSPHYPESIAATLARVDGLDKTWSFKFTGAGGEDAILVMGDTSSRRLVAQELTALGWHKTTKHFSEQGIAIVGEKS